LLIFRKAHISALNFCVTQMTYALTLFQTFSAVIGLYFGSYLFSIEFSSFAIYIIKVLFDNSGHFIRSSKKTRTTLRRDSYIIASYRNGMVPMDVTSPVRH